MKYKHKRPLSWFKSGRFIIKNNVTDLFNPVIEILSPAHGKAIHATQDAGNRYELIK